MEPSTAEEHRRVAEVRGRLASIGVPFVNIKSWHHWVDKVQRSRPDEPVDADVANMTNAQVVAFVRRHAVTHQHAMLLLWTMQDRYDDAEIRRENYADWNRYDLWRAAAFEIAGVDGDDQMRFFYPR